MSDRIRAELGRSGETALASCITAAMPALH